MGSAVAVAIIFVVVAILLLNSSSSGGGSGDLSTGAGGPAPPAGSLNPLIPTLASAIAMAEGYGVPGAVPTRANNPGDLVLGDVGLGVANSEGVTIYANATAGWNALYNELNLIFTGSSHVYSLAMTFAQMAQKWTGGDNAGAWAAIVVSNLAVTVDSTLADWIGGNS